MLELKLLNELKAALDRGLARIVAELEMSGNFTASRLDAIKSLAKRALVLAKRWRSVAKFTPDGGSTAVAVNHRPGSRT
jgi:hypothetical protein